MAGRQTCGLPSFTYVKEYCIEASKKPYEPQVKKNADQGPPEWRNMQGGGMRTVVNVLTESKRTKQS